MRIRLFQLFRKKSVPFQIIGKTTNRKEDQDLTIHRIHHSPFTVLDEDMRVLRAIWEETSYQLDRLQRDHACVEEEKKNIYDRKGLPSVFPLCLCRPLRR